MFDVGGEQVQAYNDALFAQVRQKYAVQPNFLAKFDMKSLRMFGGKGGNLMAFTLDKRYLVKEISSDDQQSMLKHARTIIARQMTGESLICPLFLHFTRQGKNYVVMLNVLPADSGVIWHKKYDLKGNRDDKLLEDDGRDVVEVHKRCFYCHNCWYGCDVIPCCTTMERKRYFLGKKHAFETEFITSDAQAKRIVSMVTGDAKLLGEAGVMDYSLIIGIIRQGEKESIPPADGRNQFVFTYGGWTYVYYMGIIDFLQEWTSTKKIAAVIKAPLAPKPLSTVPPQQYADQFARAMQGKFKGLGSSRPEGAVIARI